MKGDLPEVGSFSSSIKLQAKDNVRGYSVMFVVLKERIVGVTVVGQRGLWIMAVAP